ncbi:hypothetical protein AYO21_10134 [Fonsecaea monophora]|uniref:NADH-ubiquinone oxidoreductase 9.5 kDa subunit n=1 Tax=Fonsecaea monophora TaxID=254056 RepID=A0A177EUG4_9EURO|nr:hypothetical protein AYO21_10134 [Fonsecaea monophora]KAH0846514.1 hypothetical protein FOPE_12624 [Fonsecaea pedrosoi]OAG35663.1 hypothetical protein AYO21_10134 [Fonsecaea monophora]
MSGIPQRFWGQPIRYLRWAAHEKPAIFWSCVIGGLGPATFVFIPPLRRYFGDQDPPRIPLTYPGKHTVHEIFVRWVSTLMFGTWPGFRARKKRGSKESHDGGNICQLWFERLVILGDSLVVRLGYLKTQTHHAEQH